MTEPDRLTQSPQWIFEHIRSYIDGQLQLQQAEIDRRVTTIRREIASVQVLTDRTFIERERAIAIAHERLTERIEAVRSELNITNEASERAITKSEIAIEHRLESMNEWRQQSIERERGMAEERAKLQATLLPRETFQAWKTVVEGRLNESKGEKQGISEFRANVLSVMAFLVALGTLVALVIVH